MKIGNFKVEKPNIALGLLVLIFLGGVLALPHISKAQKNEPVAPAEVIRPFVNYTPAAGESLDTIREKFGVNAETIIWSNDLDGYPFFNGSRSILLAPTSGLIYHAVNGDTWNGLSSKYGVPESELRKWNIEGINVGSPLIIPGIHYPKHQMTDQKNSAGLPALNLKQISGRVIHHGPPFSGGWCTSWVYLRGPGHISWRGNAKYWPEKARAAGWNTGKNIKVGAAYAEPWYSPWGHISLVVASNPDGSFIVSEMPTFGLGNPSYRIVPGIDSRATFIYFP